MPKNVKCQKKWRKSNLTTGQISGLTLVGHGSLYRYVREFPDFFSPTAKQHKRGRRWTQEDLEMVQAIRCLFHERTGAAKIREMLAAGWRLQDNPAFTREMQSRLIEATLAAAADAEQIATKAKKVIEDNKFASKLSLEDHHEVDRVSQRLIELEIKIDRLAKKKGIKGYIEGKRAF